MSFGLRDLAFYVLAVYCKALANVNRICNLYELHAPFW